MHDYISIRVSEYFLELYGEKVNEFILNYICLFDYLFISS